ncbi:MAG: ABC transporter permease [Patescibacteria group bacterium]
MLIIENIKFAFTSLWDNKIRSSLTMLGVIIGVFSVITLISIGEGVKEEFSNQVMDIGSNLVIVVPGQIDTESEEFNPASIVGVSALTTEDVEAIKNQVPNINETAWLTMISGIISNGDKISRSSMTIGTQPSIMDLMNQELEEGRFLEQKDIDDNARVVVLTALVKEALFEENENAIGKNITIRGEEFEVIGLIKKNEDALSFGGISFDDMIFLPSTTGEEITEQISIFRIMTQADHPDNVEVVKEKVNEVLLEQHDGSEDFSVLTQEDLLGLFESFLGILTTAISGIAAISLIVGGIGIMNIMLVSVTERTREIGIRKAIGANSINILTQFLIEAATLSCLGGALGVGVSFMVGQLITKYADLPTQITLEGLLLAVLISIAVGIVFGLAPAIKASRKSPIEALRYE